MARYIDADALIKKIFPLGMVGDGMYVINAKAVKFAIDSTPTADVAPKSEGEWVRESWISFRCSLCDKRADDFISGYEWDVDYAPKFCPNCGAKMKGELYGRNYESD